MAQAMQSYVAQWGPVNHMFFSTAVPSAAGEGPFAVGDWIINTAPTTGQVAVWICTVAGTGATATFKTLTNS